ncbi:MAG: ATP-dependent helicase [Hyphomicrobiales bacterium]|nr:MAG: ATP-dependent helicase [Hyphomicrobiales bacterium]
MSAEFRWLVAFLTQIVRPLDRRNAAVLVDTFSRMTGLELSGPQVLAEAESSGRSYLLVWFDAANGRELDERTRKLIDVAQPAVSDVRIAKKVSEDIVAIFASVVDEHEVDGYDDLSEDVAAWREITREIGRHIGRAAPLDQFLQELQLRSKEPSPGPDTVTLMTVHGAKGREFDVVYVMGLAEGIMPSFQACQKGDDSPEMEEERRNCFVAITRAKESLILSRAESYRGWHKEPSRFLVEMELLN